MAREGPCTAWAEAGRDRGVHQVRAQRRGHDDGAGQSVDAAAISFLFELIERSYTSRSTAPCAQHMPAEWHVRLGGGVQAVAMVCVLSIRFEQNGHRELSSVRTFGVRAF